MAHLPSQEWLGRKVTSDPDMDCDASTPDPLTAALARIARLEEALKPFAEDAALFNDIPGVYRCNDDVELWQKSSLRSPLNVGDLRRARDVLNEGKTG